MAVSSKNKRQNCIRATLALNEAPQPRLEDFSQERLYGACRFACTQVCDREVCARHTLLIKPYPLLLKRRSWYLWSALILVALSTVIVVYRGWRDVKDTNHIVVWDSWRVPLPRGGSITYRNQSPRMRPMIGPADTTKILIWQKPKGQTREYLISQIGAGFSDLEFFARPDGNAVWLTAWNGKQTVAALDLETGRCYAGGVTLTAQGEQDESASDGVPSWAVASKGHLLGRKKF